MSPPDGRSRPSIAETAPTTLSTPTDQVTTDYNGLTIADPDLTALLFDTLGFTKGEFVSVCRQKPGGTFRASVMPPDVAPLYAAALGDAQDIWFSVNPTRGPRREDCGRGTAEQTTRLADLYADLDVKDGAFADIQTAENAIDELSASIGQRPTVVVFSGHGLQPHWPVEDGAITDTFPTSDAAPLLRRWGRLVEIVAERHGAKVDNVFDLARVLRVPGTVNNKIHDDPVPVTARRDTGAPLTLAEIDDRLNELGIHEQPDDTTSTEELSNPDGWEFAPKSCPYTAKWISGLATDQPLPGKGRNPWACNQAVRLHCAWRLGCISEADFDRAEKLLEEQLTRLLGSTEPRRPLRKFEMRDAFRLGRKRAASKTVEQASAELGDHTHTPPAHVLEVDRIGTAEATTTAEDQPQTDTEAIEGMPRLWRATDLKAAAQPSWLAKNRIQRAAINLLIGDEGIGKSLLWVWIVASVTTGKELPEFGIPARDPAHVILVCTEDDWQTTVLPRLQVAGADLTMIQVICTDDDGSGAPTFPRDLFLIAEADPAPVAVFVDAWLDTVPSGLSVKDPQQARQALHPWKELATTTGAAVLLICHTNRVASANARDRYGATIELRKKARVTLFAQQDDEGKLVVGPEKMNTAAAVAASQFTIEAVQHFPPTTDHDGTVPRLTHVGESTLTAREHLAEIYAANHDTTARDDAVAWLASYLAAGPRWAKDAHNAGEQAGYSEKKRYTAKKRLGVEATRADGVGPWFWRLPQHADRQPEHPDGQMPPVSAIWPSGPSGGHLVNPHNLSTSQDILMTNLETQGAPGGEPLCRCGNQLMSPTSIWRGYCERCRLDSKDGAA